MCKTNNKRARSAKELCAIRRYYAKKNQKSRDETSAERRIYKTTDGYFSFRADIKKPRRVAVIHQRDDGAIAVVKIYSKKNKSGDAYIPGVVLKTNNHSSLSENSIVGNKLIYGRKDKKQIKAMYPDELTDTQDKLLYSEYLKIKRKVNADTKEHKKSRDKTIKRWKNHFK